MCGITGVLSFNQQSVNEQLINDMITTLPHRGPDSHGVWCYEGVGLGHVRLSIHDLSEAGHQPMLSHSGKWVIVFNGEIYNYQEMRSQLAQEYSLVFKSDSDTEVLINAIEHWGVEQTLQKCIGMFAFCAFDRKADKLYLARDRFGEKPLYYGQQNNTFAFASELKALKPLKSLTWKFDVDHNVLATYMRYGYVPTPYSIYKNIYKLEPGCYLEISEYGKSKVHSYWRAKDALSKAKFNGSYQDAVGTLEQKLKETLKLQMASDVPLGAFLSGGVDSTTIVALMQSMSTRKINTFSIGFYEDQFNEAEYARDVARHLDTNHTDMYVSEREALDVIPKLSLMYDEPFADSSQIPTYLVSKIAKSKVTVSLSGDAGDELFGGYNRYFLAQKLKQRILDKAVVRFGISNMPNAILKVLGKVPSKYAHFSDKLLKLKQIIRNSGRSPESLYQQICSQIYQTNFVLGGNEIAVLDHDRLVGAEQMNFQEWMMYTDSQTYMMDDILTKVDRAAMATSLETRVPFLDHRIFEFAWALPLEYKIKNGIGKHVLRDVLYQYVPQKLIDRPKMGFGVPLAKWLRGDLRDWAESLLNPGLLVQQGYLEPNVVQRYWQQHLHNKSNWQAALWNILMFQAWLEEWNN